ncbi:MAG: hypothetical protein M3Z03_00675 [Actinomycetota bacterium]|nr:hypothetical protein [Actinomycetota bacterium]
MRRTPVIGFALVLALGFTAGACGGSDDDDPEDIRAELSEQFQEGADGFSEKQADCFADVLVDEVGADELADVDFSDEEPPAELQEAFTKAAIKAVADCDIPLAGE